MRFAAPYAFLLLMVLPAVAWAQLRARRTGAVRFPSLDRVATLRPTLRWRLRRLPLALRLAAAVLMIVALARPQVVTSETRISTEGIAVEMVVDRSGSMGAEMDFDGERMTRLDAVKRVFKEFVLGNDDTLPGRPNDLIGMVAFARYADTVCPLVRAHDALARFAETTRLVQHRAEDGTAIGDALALAAARLRKAEEEIRRREDGPEDDRFVIKSKVIILLTDGRHNAGKTTPRQAAAIARDWGIKIYAIGMGGGEAFTTIRTPLGAMKVPAGGDLDEETLRAVADTAGGRYFAAADADGLRRVYAEIDRLEKSDIEALEFAQYDEAFPPYALAAGALLLAEVLLACTWLRRVP
jgi:Ca-activated chloride channel family protein